MRPMRTIASVRTPFAFCSPRHLCCSDGDDNPEARTLFFAKVLRTDSDADVRRLFEQFGTVEEVNLFRAFVGAPTNKVGLRLRLDGW